MEMSTFFVINIYIENMCYLKNLTVEENMDI